MFVEKLIVSFCKPLRRRGISCFFLRSSSLINRSSHSICLINHLTLLCTYFFTSSMNVQRLLPSRPAFGFGMRTNLPRELGSVARMATISRSCSTIAAPRISCRCSIAFLFCLRCSESPHFNEPDSQLGTQLPHAMRLILSVCLDRLSVCMSVYQSVFLLFCLSGLSGLSGLSVCLSVCVCVCVCVCERLRVCVRVHARVFVFRQKRSHVSQYTPILSSSAATAVEYPFAMPSL